MCAQEREMPLCAFSSFVSDQKHLKSSVVCGAAGSSDRTHGVGSRPLCFCKQAWLLFGEKGAAVQNHRAAVTQEDKLLFSTPHTEPVTLLTTFLMAGRRAKA